MRYHQPKAFGVIKSNHLKNRRDAHRGQAPATVCCNRQRTRTDASAVLIITLLCCISVTSGIPASPSSMKVDAFGSMLLLENGRKKPIDTYARNKLLQFSGKRRIAKSSALEWMTGLMLDPTRADYDKVFLINNPDFAQTLGISPERKRRYSYAALSGAIDNILHYQDRAMKTAEKNRTEFDREIIRIYSNLIDYRYIASTMSFIEPDIGFHLSIADSSGSIPPVLLDPTHPPSFLDMLQLGSFHTENMQRIQRQPLDSLSETDRAIVAVTKRMFEISQTVGNPEPHIILLTENGAESWMSPWGFVGQYRSVAVKSPFIESLVTITRAYRSRDQQAFDRSIATFKRQVQSSNAAVALPDPTPELLYNHLNTFFIAKVLLGLAALLALIGLFSKKRPVAVASMAGIIAAFALCTFGIILRMLIMRHPPVTNLYETFIFVAWTTMIIGMFIEFAGIRSIGLVTASLAGFIFLHVAGRYAADGDTLGMLAAVLDSGFWLTTHIITIALGYAGCMGAAFIGHIYLVKKLLSPSDKAPLAMIGQAVYGVFAFGFLFTTIGTVTGGMWADQAWGRFWGWDPKENGALLIILWCAIIFHARMSRRIADAGMAAGAIVSAILVMCTWIGVNLLGTGLHSYGFTTSGAKMLFGYSGFELLFLAIIGSGIFMRRNARA
jgi:cytochrome c-type biogenesis protein CcsB